MSVGSDQPGGGRRDRTNDRKLPCTGVSGVDLPNPIRPWCDVEVAALTEVEQHRPRIVQEGEDPQRAIGGDHVEVRHAAPEHRVSLSRSYRMSRPDIMPAIRLRGSSILRS